MARGAKRRCEIPCRATSRLQGQEPGRCATAVLSGLHGRHGGQLAQVAAASGVGVAEGAEQSGRRRGVTPQAATGLNLALRGAAGLIGSAACQVMPTGESIDDDRSGAAPARLRRLGYSP